MFFPLCFSRFQWDATSFSNVSHWNSIWKLSGIIHEIKYNNNNHQQLPPKNKLFWSNGVVITCFTSEKTRSSAPWLDDMCFSKFLKVSKTNSYLWHSRWFWNFCFRNPYAGSKWCFRLHSWFFIRNQDQHSTYQFSELLLTTWFKLAKQVQMFLKVHLQHIFPTTLQASLNVARNTAHITSEIIIHFS